MSKEMWFRHYERLLNEGLSDEHAAEQAFVDLREQLADWADIERKRRREDQS